MRDSLKIALGIIIGCAVITAILICGFIALTLFLGVSPFPSGSQEPSLRSILGQSTTFDVFEVTVDSYEFSGSYEDNYQSTRDPPEGAKFVWVHVTVQNLGQTAELAPGTGDFKLVHLGDEIGSKPGYRNGYPDYTSGFLIGEKVYPGVVHEGWLRFIVPVAAEASDLDILFNPWGSNGEHRWGLSP